jgi:NAD-dependent deacetylase
LDLEQTALAQERLASAGAVTVLTGAGISADSGIPTFRGAEGLWRTFKPEELATPEAFERDPGTVWEWYSWRRDLIATKQPNPAHHALVALEKTARSFTLITQNVDGFHTLAGSQNVIELHGNIWKTRCVGCRRIVENRTPALKTGTSPLPACDRCHAVVRPHIVWFGENLAASDLERSLLACRQAEVMLVIGTSGVVQPAASFASMAQANGAFVIEINLASSLADPPDAFLMGRASERVPELLSNLSRTFMGG